jgi:hypothetical protein
MEGDDLSGFHIVSIIFNKNYIIVSSIYILVHTWGDPKIPGIVKKNLFKVFE